MLIVVGAGAAGLAAAITAARRGIEVLLLEQNDRPGKKILVSGNGRCNIANRRPDPARFHSTRPELVKKTLQSYDAKRILDFLRSVGIETEEEEEEKLFPMGRQAASVVKLLTRECQRLGVRIVTECQVTGIRQDQKEFVLESSKGSHRCRQLLLTTGSPAAPQLGGSNAGMFFAQSLGHRLIPPRPALVALESGASWTKQAAGVKLPARVGLLASGSLVTEREGDLLFTDYGVSGLAVLDLSREASLRLAEWEPCELSIDLMPNWSKERLNKLLTARIDPERNLPLELWLEGVLHRKLVPIILKIAGIKTASERDLNRKMIGRLVYTIKHLKLPIQQTRDFRYAEVAAGGIDLAEIDPERMESRKVPGLYFAGEILDVDGDRGGFNFHWAWTTGMRAGMSVRS
ncbi:NAD(P)/FAD-dependent oxidoreductase [Nitratifractor sp.]|uniref:NAD(P)/FAD-dependent oxidoreductase n=1 Tax=Nitratifractor sp. TaxID=2268144 RepID=UPI0025CCB03F|nr:NAD(P)/FAD-dependent oxidoreductase [Nitratifractor sp.]